MTIMQAIILGLIQGLAEFLPISSSGHLVLFQKIFHINEPTMVFDVVLHIGTLIPVLIVFWDKIYALLKKPFQKYTYKIIIATLPAVMFALLFGDLIEDLFSSGRFLALSFAATGIILMYADKVSNGKKNDEQILFVDSWFIGIMQGIAIIPGVSRSGSTIAASLSKGLSRKTAARFSFILSIPAILGAAVLQFKNVLSGQAENSITFAPMLFGFLSAMISGYFSIRFMIKLISQRKLNFFAVYLFALSFLIALDQLFFRLYF